MAINNSEKNFIFFKPFNNVNIIDVGKTNSIIESISKSLNHLKDFNQFN